jgi:ABC-type bacteriocin/lantibiotic exporter with double-glycine peptidase domain
MSRRFLAPEVVQSSAMDCGPAALKCLLEGFGIQASYGRLREACQTDVDGTSIDTMEEVARQLGLDAVQIMLPADQLLLPVSEVLPAILVVRQPGGSTHFLVVWRRTGNLIQVMDPAIGRRWVTTRYLLDQLYVHAQAVPCDGWREWAGSEDSRKVLRHRLSRIGVRADDLVARATADKGWRPLAALDAATRLVTSLVRAGSARRGRQATALLGQFLEKPDQIPDAYWSVRPHEDDQLTLRGAVLVHVRGVLPASERPPIAESRELEAALREAPLRPGRELLDLLRADGVLAPAVLTASLLVAAAAVLLEAVLFRGLFDLGRELGLAGQRLGAVAAIVGFLLALLLLEFPLEAGLVRLGRHLEVRLRQAFLTKIPRLGDRYFQSRLRSDMAERSHSIHRIRTLPELGGNLFRYSFELLITVAGIAWLDPNSLPLAALAAAAGLVLPLMLQPAIVERDLRVRAHAGALSRYYLDALLGLVPIRVHGAEALVRREHSKLLAEWAHSSLGLQKAVVAVEGLQFTLGFGLAGWLLLDHLARSAETGGALLLVYWALNLPVLGQEIALIAWQYPSMRNTSLRLLEPLGALETETPKTAEKPPTDSGARLSFQQVTVRAAGHTILEDINLEIASSSHVAIVGPSGAGKSSFVGILLGWYQPASGNVLVDGLALDQQMAELRRQTAWVDPSVQVWNRSLLDNLSYGAQDGASPPLGDVLEQAQLRQVLERLPEGLETQLGEGGALVSGGEGQRVRLGRAMFRGGSRLVILDEPFRGLGLDARQSLLARARELWRGATLICITHDIGQTLGFERVLVIENGRIAEDGSPAGLAAKADSRFRALLDAEHEVRQGLWSGREWRRIRLQEGRIAS